MFESLSERLQLVMKKLRGQARVSDEVLAETLREIRLALLEADVAVPVVKRLLDAVKTKAQGVDVQGSLTPGQQVVKIVRDELVSLLGGEGARDLMLGSNYPAVVMLVGLQGSGKTTTTAKIGRLLKARRRFPFLVPADIARPAAIAQLVKLATDAGLGVLDHDGKDTPLGVVKKGMIAARQKGYDVVLIDTAGRLHVDDALMAELGQLKEDLHPAEILFVADAMTGQDAVRSAAGFAAALPLTGIVFTKTDGDARGGAALSVVTTVGKPIKFVGVGEKLEDFEPFHPDRMSSRILGLGDVLTLIEKVEAQVDASAADKLARRASAGEFTLEDLRDQLRSMKKMGPVSGILDLLPKGGAFRGLSTPDAVDEKSLVRIAAIIDSMTPDERRYPQLLNGSRKKRIASGSATSVAEINRLLKQYQQMRRLMRTARKGVRGLDLSRLPLPAPRN